MLNKNQIWQEKRGCELADFLPVLPPLLAEKFAENQLPQLKGVFNPKLC